MNENAEPIETETRAQPVPLRGRLRGLLRRNRLRVAGAGALALAGAGAGLWLWQAGEPAPAPRSEPGMTFEIEAGREFAEEFDLEMPMPQVSAGGEEGVLGKVVSLEPFVVNITDGDRDRYLKLGLDLELSDESVTGELDERMPQIRDLIISLVGAKTFQDVRTIEGKNFLREEILLRVNSLLVSGSARRIFFTEFVVQ